MLQEKYFQKIALRFVGEKSHKDEARFLMLGKDVGGQKMRLIFLSIFLALATFTIFAQGNLDQTFNSSGTKGYRVFPMSPDEEIIGVDTQLYSPDYNHIIVASRRDSVGHYIVRKFDRDSGAVLNTRFITVGGNAYANAMLVLEGKNEIYIAGTGASPNICTLVKVEPDLSKHTVHNFTLPSPLTRCQITDLEIYQGQIIALGTSYNPTTNKIGLTTLRYWHNPLPLGNNNPIAINPNWEDNWHAQGMARTEFTNTTVPATLLRSVSLGMTPTRTFVAGIMQSGIPSSPTSGTVIVAYSRVGLVGPVLSGFGNRDETLNTNVGKGVFIIKDFIANDMIAIDPNTLILSGIDTNNQGKFSFVRLTFPAASTSDITNFPAVDFLTKAEATNLKINGNYNGVIVGGKCGTLVQEVCLAQYDLTASNIGNLKTNWTNPTNNLWKFDLTGTNTNQSLNGDRRRIMYGNPAGTSIRFTSSSIQRTTGKIIVVAQKRTGSLNDILMMRLNK